MDQGRMWERRGGYERVEVRRGEVRKWTDVPLQPHQSRRVCKGNLTDLRRILHLSLAKGKYIMMVDIICNTCPAKGNPKRML
jgi:hypothetical protein